MTVWQVLAVRSRLGAASILLATWRCERDGDGSAQAIRATSTAPPYTVPPPPCYCRAGLICPFHSQHCVQSLLNGTTTCSIESFIRKGWSMKHCSSCRCAAPALTAPAAAEAGLAAQTRGPSAPAALAARPPPAEGSEAAARRSCIVRQGWFGGQIGAGSWEQSGGRTNTTQRQQTSPTESAPEAPGDGCDGVS